MCKKGTSFFKKVIAQVLVVFNIIVFIPYNSFAATKEKLVVGGNYSGFILKETKQINEIDSKVYLFEHVRTGADLVYIKNTDTNKVFSISFKTPANDNTGVNHILEHSVLCGSQKYTVKDPFLQMMNRSLNTYLNAYTMPDSTSYPVASRNEKDFNNLMSIYLDAVFFPEIYMNPMIFQQEGWRYELETKDAPLKINGIVYNEMKGAYSDPMRALGNEVSKSLYPDTANSKEAGGLPESIPELTYGNFILKHEAYYHPSNSCIYLYGNMDILKTLEFINEFSLSKFNRKNVYTNVAEQKAFTSKKTTVTEYSIGNGEATEDKTYLSLNYVVGKTSNKEDIIGLSLLDSLLLQADASPLKKALNDSKIGERCYGNFDLYRNQPFYSIIVENSNEQSKEQFEKVVNDTLKKIIKEGFDKELVNAILNSYELENRKSNSSAERGMNYIDAANLGWKYSNAPLQYLGEEDVIKKIKSSIDSKYFEKLIEKYLLYNNHSSIVVSKPAPGLAEKKDTALTKKLAGVKAKLTQRQINQIMADNKALKSWQEKSDSTEALATIPSLALTDISKEPEITPTEIEEINGIKVLNHPVFTSGISNVHMYFDASKVPQDKVEYLHLLSSLLGRMDTEKYDMDALTNEVMNLLGGFTTSTAGYWKYNGNGEYEPKTDVYFNAADENLEKAFGLVDEILNKTKFNNKETLLALLQESKANLENQIMTNGGSIASSRVNSFISDVGQYNETSSLTLYDFLCDLEKNYDTKYPDIVKNLNEVMETIFNKNNLIVSYTGNSEKYANFKKNFTPFSDKIGNKVLPAQTYKFDTNIKSEGITTPSLVQYVVQANNYNELGYKYNGSMAVLSNILNGEFMWPEVRVKGGAYGGNFLLSKSGFMQFYSYRDPNLKETLDVYNEADEFLKNFKATDEQMLNYIIGTIGQVDYLTEPGDKGKYADWNYIRGISDDDLRKERAELLNTKASDIVKYADLIEKAIKDKYHCTVGGEAKINQNKDLFESIRKGINQ